jgi:50S ribosomal protein L16 3-hydroxylase
MHLAHFDIATFLRDYWQQQPLLIRNPWARWTNPLDPDELAGLACEEGVEARLITQAQRSWALEEGPFPESRFGTLGKDPWTLLVQAVDHHVPDVAALIAPFRFIPNWRVDDVMVSYATDGGGVGPHFDQYDVFLVQGLGRRRWQIGAPCDAETALLPHDDLRLLAEFEPTAEWILEPGDILYVPPRVPHHGVAVGDDCMTYSIGFRAPAHGELLAHWSDHLLDAIPDDDRYADPGLLPQDNPGEISPAAIAGLRDMIASSLLDTDAFARWFGSYNSTPKYPDIDWRPEEPIEINDLRERLGDDAPLCRNPASRFSFIRREGQGVLLFADGACFDCEDEAATFAERVCAQDRIAVDPDLAKSARVLHLIAALIDQGSLAFDDDA